MAPLAPSIQAKVSHALGSVLRAIVKQILPCPLRMLSRQIKFAQIAVGKELSAFPLSRSLLQLLSSYAPSYSCSHSFRSYRLLFAFHSSACSFSSLNIHHSTSSQYRSFVMKNKDHSLPSKTSCQLLVLLTSFIYNPCTGLL